MTKCSARKTSVLYNADCPVCSYEINHYAKFSAAQSLPIGFDDLNDKERLDAWGLDTETAAKRLHVLKDGQLYSGIPAFIELWQEMPKYRWLARIVSLPGVFHVAVLIYDNILAPLIYRSHIKRVARNS